MFEIVMEIDDFLIQLVKYCSTSINENVINQGLFYLDWLLDHKAEFKLKVMEIIDAKVANDIEWGDPRLICIAGDFTKYDVHAIQQINRNIELLRYQKYEDDLLLLDLVSATDISISPTGSKNHLSPLRFQTFNRKVF